MIVYINGEPVEVKSWTVSASHGPDAREGWSHTPPQPTETAFQVEWSPDLEWQMLVFTLGLMRALDIREAEMVQKMRDQRFGDLFAANMDFMVQIDDYMVRKGMIK